MAEEFKYDTLIAGGISRFLSKGVIVQKGGVYKRGTVMALVSSSNGIDTVAPVNSTAAAPLNSPHCILADVELDTTASAVPAAVFYEGEFNPQDLIFQGTDTVDTFFAAMRAKGMYIKTVIGGLN